MFAARVDDRVEACDGAADAAHPEIKKFADGRGPSPHHVVHGQIENDR
jgi:hypothetical protein